MELWPHQIAAIKAINDRWVSNRDSLVVLPTASGKTQIFVSIAEDLARKGARTVILTNRMVLVDQTFKKIDGATIFCASLGRKEIGNITIASLPSIYRVKEKFDYIIMDEAHEFAPRNMESRFKTFMENQDKAKYAGFTASPYRANGYIYGKKDSWFEGVTYKKDIKEMITGGFLVVPRMKRVEHQFNTKGIKITAGDYNLKELGELVDDEEKAKAQVANALDLMSDRKKIVWACCTIKHAEMISELLNFAPIVHSEMNMVDRNENMRRFENGDDRHIISVTALSTGWDYPPADGLVLLRPTRSPVLYVQLAGRVLRASPGKSDAIIADFGRIVETLGPLDKLRIYNSGEKSKPLSPMKFCPKCYEYMGKEIMTCECCGYAFPIKEPKEVNRFKNLSTVYSDADILSSSVARPKTHWVDISRVVISGHRTQKGRMCTKIIYWPVNVLAHPIIEFLSWGESINESWMNKRAREKLALLGITATSFHDVKDIKDVPVKIEKILVEYKQFPEVKEIKYG